MCRSRTRCALFLVALLLAGCSSASAISSLAPVTPGDTPARPSASGYRELYAFRNTPDGAAPQTGLSIVGGKFYGATFGGGAKHFGAIFQSTPAGSERLLYSFKGGKDGINPYMTLTEVGGVFYGDTAAGGEPTCHIVAYGDGCGTIFSLTLDGKERVLYRFKGGDDGYIPQVTLLDVKGVLYGTTNFGGGTGCIDAEGCGTIFAVTTSGTERLLHAFEGRRDGAYPEANLIYANGLLYGTTFSGGTHNDGTVFSIDLQGTERVLYSFKGGDDGAHPWGNVIAVGNTLYGTTVFGGGGTPHTCYHSTGLYGCGTIFAVTTGGVERIVHRFGNGAQGANPLAGLTYANGMLYGVTANGGNSGCSGSTWGCGVVFRLKKRGGGYDVLHYFSGAPSDGATPQGNLIEYDGNFYDTTLVGGASNQGTIFRIGP